MDVISDIARALEATGCPDLAARVRAAVLFPDHDPARVLQGVIQDPGCPEVVFVLAVTGKRMLRDESRWREDFKWLAAHAGEMHERSRTKLRCRRR